MKHKLTPFDLALWAALPMAHTSKIEGRLTMILDSTRKRTLPRRVLIWGVALAAAALVPLAMLRPTAKAQAVLQEVSSVQLLGIQDIDIHHTDHRWWNAAGEILTDGVNAGAPSRTATDLFRSSTDKNLRFAVRLLDKGSTVTFVPTGSFLSLPQETASPSGNVWALNAAFPSSQRTTALSVGVATGPWIETADCPKRVGKVRLSRPSGDVLFMLLPNTSVEEMYGSRGQTPPPSASGSAVLIVSDHFHSASPLPVDRMAEMISSYASRTRSGDAVQKMLHDGENYERAVYGLDKSGRMIAKLTGTYDPMLEEEADDRFKMEQLLSIPKPLLKHIASFRLVARPYQWTEFKNVALQPSAQPQASSLTSEPDQHEALRLDQARQIREHLAAWAQANKAAILTMQQAQPNDLAALMPVYRSLAEQPFPLWSGDPRVQHGTDPGLAVDTPFGMTLTHLQRSHEWIFTRIREDFADNRDFRIASSLEPGSVSIVLWASGRITEAKTSNKFVARGKPILEVESQKSLLPGFFPPPDETQ